MEQTTHFQRDYSSHSENSTLVGFMEICCNCSCFVEQEDSRIGICDLYNVPVYWNENCTLFTQKMENYNIQENDTYHILKKIPGYIKSMKRIPEKWVNLYGLKPLTFFWEGKGKGDMKHE